MKDFLTYLASGIVEHDDKVQVEIGTEEDFLLARISAHPDDIGKIIGKQGKIIRAIRALARVRATADNKKVRVDVTEPEGENS